MAPKRAGRGCQQDGLRVSNNSATAQRRGGPRPDPNSTIATSITTQKIQCIEYNLLNTMHIIQCIKYNA